MNILVTGGAGFIGKEVCYYLKNKGHNVIIVDFPNVYYSKLKINHITDELEKDFKCYGFDISKSQSFKQIEEDIDIIVHCAAQSGGYPSLIYPQADCDWNCKGTLNVVNFAKERKIKKIIYISSMACYGNGSYLKETDELKPISNYGVSKLSGEYYVKTLNEYGIDYTILRFFNTYGFGQDMNNLKQGMVSIYLSQALKTGKIEVTGSFDRIRDHIHVNDEVTAIELSINDNRTNNQTYNVCYGRETTVKELLDMINNLFDNKLEIKEIEGYPGDQFGNSGNSNKLKELGWKPQIKLEEGIKEFYDKEISYLI